MNKRKRVYICHTFYHAYVTLVKELVMGRAHFGEADLLLSTMSNDFGLLADRIREENIFGEVHSFDERPPSSDEEVMRYHEDRGSLFLNLLQRIRYTRLLGALQEEVMPVDLSAYEDVYIYCDSDPVGYYCNYKKIPYHAIEDGLNSGLLDNQARTSNRGAFPLKVLFAKLGLIFIECGYSRYCIDYEVNDLSKNYKPAKNTIEVPRAALYARLTDEDHELLARLFLPQKEEVLRALSEKGEKPCALLLTEPLCDLDTRKRLFGDIIEAYEKTHRVLVKPHPRDVLDYRLHFPETVVLAGAFPMEVLQDVTGLTIDLLISVITQIDDVSFAKDTVYLGLDFLDRYEDPAIHRQTDALWKASSATPPKL